MTRLHVASLVSILAAACGGPALTTHPPAPVDVAGHWTSACTPAPQPDGTTRYFTLDFHNTTDHWQVAYTVFADPACTTGLVIANIDGRYEIGGPAAVAGAREAVFHFDHKTLTPVVPPLVQALDHLGCGQGAVGAARDIYAHGCPAFGQYPRAACSADYDLVWRQGDELRFGKRPADNDMCSPARRPSELAELVLHRS